MAFSVFCPECSSALEVEEEHRNWTVRCPNCRHEFRPSESTAAAPTDEPAAFGLMQDDESPAPRRKRRRPVHDDEEYEADSAEADISGPATSLKVVGWIGVVFSLIGLGIWILLLVIAINMPPGQGNQQGQPPQGPFGPAQDRDEILAQAAIYIPQSIVALGVSIVMLIGAGKMARLESHSWAMTAAVIGMVPCISPCCLLGLPFGIWALSVLNKPHVQAAFRRNTRRRESRFDDDD